MAVKQRNSTTIDKYSACDKKGREELFFLYIVERKKSTFFVCVVFQLDRKKWTVRLHIDSQE